MLKQALIFGEHMVLQRNKNIPVWGIGEDGQTVTVSIFRQEVSTVVKNGKWMLTLDPMEAAIGLDMTITNGVDTIVLHDVSVGEVWLAGGQSNMEFYLRYDKEHDQVIENGENPCIHFFDYPEVSYVGQLEENDYSNFGFWRPCTRENMDYYSAVAYYFAEKLQSKYQVPVGIVGCNWGGTSASCWMSEEYLEDNEGYVWLEEYRQSLKELDLTKYEEEFRKNALSYTGKPFENAGSEVLLYGLPKEQMLALRDEFEKVKGTMMPPIGPKSPWRPCGLYYSMLKEVAPYAIRGVIWYQGESDDIHADIYDIVLSNMIRCWRDLWSEEIPFLLTQLAPLDWWFSGEVGAYVLIREKQEQVTEQVPNVWMTSIGDVGMEVDVHPKEKRPVGERLALLAMNHVYGEDILSDPPKCVDVKVEDGLVTLTFIHAEGGLELRGGHINALKCYANGQLIEAYTVTVENENIFLRNEAIQANGSVEVQFAMELYHEVNVYNQAGVPVRPFRISN